MQSLTPLRANRRLSRHAGALTPSLLPALLSVLGSGIVSVALTTPGYGIARHELPDWQPPAIDDHTLAVARAACDELAEHLEAIVEADLADKLGVFLSHRWRWQSDRPLSPQYEELRQQDWIVDLCSYPAWAISVALGKWRREHPEYPTIAEIVGLCEAEVADDRRSWRLLHKLIQAQKKEAA